MVEKYLYFMALVPPEPVKSLIHEMKMEFYKKYRFSHALKSPPHITLIPPFKWPVQDENRLVRFLKDFALQQAPFEISLDGYGAFKPRVIFLKINENEMLHNLYKSLTASFYPYFHLPSPPDRPYRPHLTLAFRDVTPAMFRKAWAEWKNKHFEATFKVEGICLLKHNRKNWDEYFVADFGG